MELGLIAILIAAGMVWTMTALPLRLVSWGYFRSTLLVALGLCVVGILAQWSGSETFARSILIGTAALTYLSFAIWSLEKEVAGRISLVALSCLFGWYLFLTAAKGKIVPLELTSLGTSALLLGTSMGAMLLGHYYLTAPTMSLTALQGMTFSIILASVLRMATAGTAAAIHFGQAETSTSLGSIEWSFYIALRWVVGLIAPAVLAILVLRILRYKNTQAATGILYVIVIAVLAGEPTAFAVGRIVGSRL